MPIKIRSMTPRTRPAVRGGNAIFRERESALNNERQIRLMRNSHKSQSEKTVGEQGPGDRSKEAA